MAPKNSNEPEPEEPKKKRRKGNVRSGDLDVALSRGPIRPNHGRTPAEQAAEAERIRNQRR